MIYVLQTSTRPWFVLAIHTRSIFYPKDGTSLLPLCSEQHHLYMLVKRVGTSTLFTKGLKKTVHEYLCSSLNLNWTSAIFLISVCHLPTPCVNTHTHTHTLTSLFFIFWSEQTDCMSTILYCAADIFLAFDCSTVTDDYICKNALGLTGRSSIH